MMTLFPLMLAQNQYSFSGAESGGHVKVVGKSIELYILIFVLNKN
jgi:hypothetical protein